MFVRVPSVTGIVVCLALLLEGCSHSKSPDPGTSPTRNTDTATSTMSEAATAIRFRERVLDESVAFAFHGGESHEQSTILAGMGGGVGVIDFDRDDRLDLLFPGGGRIEGGRISSLPSALMRGGEDWEYTRCETSAGVNPVRHYSHGVAIGDVDNDGFPDVLLTGYGGLQLLLNHGDGTFADATDAAGLADHLWSTSAAWGDFNGDGHLDLYVAHYVDWSFDKNPECRTVDGTRRERCPPQQFGPLPDLVYLSNCDGTFTESSADCGLRRDGKGLGVVVADFDLDRDVDIYVANDTVGNFLYRNDGTGHFAEVAVAGGAAFNDTGMPEGSMGIATADINFDGLPELWVTNYERETIGLYKNLGNCNFEHISQRAGVATVGTMFVGFGTVFLDADRDGDEDVFVANGHVLRYPNDAPVRQLPLCFENQTGFENHTGPRFVNVAPQIGDYGRVTHIGRGVGCGDFDGDGDVDLAVSHLDDPVALLENVTADQNGWLAVRLIGTRSNRDAVGARAELRTSAGSQFRQVSSGDSYLSQSDRSLFWGIPKGRTIESLTIEWPGGKTQRIIRPATNRKLILYEPAE